mmetsp:Transcript_6607/g.11163  ORF Transcript_6607/g.11163 Transcript_6607/m.11163 type:complete len:223 (+) Transcript_6607:78-746(+)
MRKGYPKRAGDAHNQISDPGALAERQISKAEDLKADIGMARDAQSHMASAGKPMAGGEVESQMTNTMAGEAESQITKTGMSAPSVEEMLGYFSNRDGWYGRDCVEYIHVGRAEPSHLVAVKIVGDESVPRGELTWRSEAGSLLFPTLSMSIQLHLRDSNHSTHPLWWSPFGRHVLQWQSSNAPQQLNAFDIVGKSPTGRPGHFQRVSEAEALNVARHNPDCH